MEETLTEKKKKENVRNCFLLAHEWERETIENCYIIDWQIKYKEDIEPGTVTGSLEAHVIQVRRTSYSYLKRVSDW
jgi:hypothetical protein